MSVASSSAVVILTHRKRQPLGRLLRRALRLCCVVCGRGRPYTSPFSMRRRCTECGFGYYRESGYYLPSIYVGYISGVLVALGLLLALLGFTRLPVERVLLVTLGFSLVYPLWFLRYARLIWLAITPGGTSPGRATSPARSRGVPPGQRSRLWTRQDNQRLAGHLRA